MTQDTATGAPPNQLMKTLCSSCFDIFGKRIIAILPQQVCDYCEKKCLGYQTEIELK